MGMKNWLGFGGCLFQQLDTGGGGALSIELSGAAGRIYYQPVKTNPIITDNHKKIIRTLGFFPYVKVFRMFNVDDDDYVDWKILASILGSIVSTTKAKTIRIYPKYDSGDTGGNLFYDCYIKSDISPEDLEDLELVQKLELELEADEMIDTIPTHVHNDPGDTIDDHDDIPITDHDGVPITDG